jgi:hypothetical protein
MELPHDQHSREQSAAVMRKVPRAPLESASMPFAAQTVLEARMFTPDLEVTKHQVGSIVLHDGAQAVQRTGQQFIVGIQKPKVLATSNVQQGIARRALTPVVLVAQYPQAVWPASLQGLQQAMGFVSGAVIQHQNFHAGIGAVHHGGEAVLQIGLGVVSGHQDTQPGSIGRHGHGRSSSVNKDS